MRFKETGIKRTVITMQAFTKFLKLTPTPTPRLLPDKAIVKILDLLQHNWLSLPKVIDI